MRFLISALALSTGLVAASSSTAQMACADREKVIERLSSKYGESFSGGGLQNPTKIFEVWASEEDGTWTILMTRPDGMSCVMASGTDWRDGPLVKAMKGVPG
ncbi:MAG: hypothetical protein HRU32_10975 [Rhodobacteraceae bacterium]|nr:hypothetical protein [Paracoccaceae bacterium]